MKSWLIFLVLIPIFGKVFTHESIVANDYHYLYKQVAQSALDIPQTWRNVLTAEGLGEYSVSTLWSWTLNFFYGGLSILGLDSSLITLLFVVLPILFLGFWGISKLFDYYGYSNSWGK